MIGVVYEEVAAPAALRGVARCVWRSASEGPKRIVPDGCVDLVVGGGSVFVAGPDTAAWSSEAAGVVSGVRFVPGRASAVLGVAADELRDRRVPLGELWGRSVAERLLEGSLSPAAAVAGRLADLPAEDRAVAELIARLEAGVARVGEAAAGLVGVGQTGAGPARVGQAAAGLARVDQAATGLARAGEAAGLARAGQATAGPGRVDQAAAELARAGEAAALAPSGGGERQAGERDETAGSARSGGGGQPAEPSTEVAAAAIAGLGVVSERRLRRRFVQAVGYGPATYLRVSRFQRAVALAPRISGLAALAAAAGYADQAHLSRECRALTGLTPRDYFPRRSTVDLAVRDRLRSA
ncbi:MULTISPECIES: helix-turn-helix domain-containing protein [Amycolatopsis]|uniref:AraC family transcriptional regulator n=1 Tax=Amycolatopsis bullii TaxID=941987 RepID=A0ABQ3KFC1_9PSEU|nr:helix-turn-helix domain-containing protein [Amycolatopsis bullii]GHG21425.1 AraC family transcriptional regulator [Amycolatopsis bullii]